jgi:hypothetical protein
MNETAKIVYAAIHEARAKTASPLITIACGFGAETVLKMDDQQRLDMVARADGDAELFYMSLRVERDPSLADGGFQIMDRYGRNLGAGQLHGWMK